MGQMTPIDAEGTRRKEEWTKHHRVRLVKEVKLPNSSVAFMFLCVASVRSKVVQLIQIHSIDLSLLICSPSVYHRWKLNWSNNLLSTKPCWFLPSNLCFSWCLQIDCYYGMQTSLGLGPVGWGIIGSDTCICTRNFEKNGLSFLCILIIE